MKIAVRMDDITPDMDWGKFKNFQTLLDAHGICPLIGVVPDNRDENLNRMPDGAAAEKELVPEDFWAYIRSLQEKGWVVAMHGFRHVYTQKKGGLFPLNYFSEFAGLPLEEQAAMVGEGKRILESHGIRTDIFMAPAHSYDSNTLRALRRAGFGRMTDGFGRKPYRWKQMVFYPISFRLESSLKRKQGITTMVVHTNTVTEKDMERYRRLFSEQEMVSYGDYLEVEAMKQGFAGHMAEYILATVKHMLVKLL